MGSGIDEGIKRERERVLAIIDTFEIAALASGTDGTTRKLLTEGAVVVLRVVRKRISGED